MMYCATFDQPGEADVLYLSEVLIPTITADEVLIRVKAAGINRPDVLQRQGQYPPPPDASPILGLEVSGVVAAVGSEVDGFRVGDRAVALCNGGGYANYVAVLASQVLPLPQTIDFTVSAAIPETFFTVWANLFQMGGAQSGETVLIHGGTSGIGTTALMLCKAFGIKVLATAGSRQKCEFIESLGGVGINYKTQDFVGAALSETQGKGVDVVLDIVGAPYFEQNCSALAKDGRLIIIGTMGGATIPKLEIMPFIQKRLKLMGSTLRSRTQAEKANIAASLLDQVWPLLESGQCLPYVDRVFPFSEVAKAHQRMESGDYLGKIVLEVESP